MEGRSSGEQENAENRGRGMVEKLSNRVSGPLSDRIPSNIFL